MPLVMWFSAGFADNARLDLACLRNAAGTGSYSHDNLFHSLLGLFDVSSRVYQPDLDVFAGCRVPLAGHLVRPKEVSGLTG
ncbi:Phosphoethanolamine transferase EptA [compost metagenome]